MNENIQIIKGNVIKGYQRGRTIGYRTANIKPNIALTEGVYYGQILLQNTVYHGAISVGKNPTFDLKDLVVEVHLFHTFEEEFYGEFIKVKLMRYLRGMKKVNGITELKEMIANDCETIVNDIIPQTALLSSADFDDNE